MVYASSDVIGAACVQGASAAALALERGPNMIKELVLLTISILEVQGERQQKVNGKYHNKAGELYIGEGYSTR